MSVIMTMQLRADPDRLEAYAAENAATMQALADKAKSYGVIAHRFYGTADGQVMVVDEWPDAESFERFFTEMGPQIGPMMEAVGVTDEPSPMFWHKLETHDDVGWDSP